MQDVVDKVPCFIKFKTLFEPDNNYLYSLAQMFAECGYFLSKYIVRNHKGFRMNIYQFEPYYYENERIYVDGTLYHMTKAEYEKSILKYGFLISSNNTYANYPPRNYFFKSRELKLMKGLMYSGGKFNKTSRNNNNDVIFHIDANKLHCIHFYSDPNYWKNNLAVYCYSNVPASAIIKAKTEHLTF